MTWAHHDRAEGSAAVTPGSPAIGAHRLLGNGRSLALVTPAGEVDWWCAPDLDSPPLLWSLLDPAGAAARWVGATLATVTSGPAGPSASGVLRVDGARVACRDGLVDVEGTTCLVRLVRAERGELRLCHELALGGFDAPWGDADGATVRLGSLTATLGAGERHLRDGRWIRTEVRATAHAWSGLVVALGPDHVVLDQARRALDAAEEATARRLTGARLPRHHPERAADALAVLDACTYRATGAVPAAATTSLPEAPGGERQFDYRYSWLRDAALACSVASLLGHRAAARDYLEFVVRVAGDQPDHTTPVVDVRGGDVPPEREVPGVAGWQGSTPVRVGNGAPGQLQYDSWGLVAEAVSVHLQTGGTLDRPTWRLLRHLADRVAAEEPRPSSGIWELRDPRLLLSGDLGRWLLLDRATWIARGWRPWTRRRRWKAERDRTRDRVLAALDADGGLPQAYGDEAPRPDASALMAVLFGLLARDDPRAARLVDATLADLEAGPFLYRYPPSEDDGFAGLEGTFLPTAWWAVAALAITGRVEQARPRADELCARLPRLLAEEVDATDGTALGNVPLVWSHVELARALYVLDAAALRERWGAAGLWAWRLGRYAVLRLRPAGEPPTSPRPHAAPQEGTAMFTPETGTALRERPAGPAARTIRPEHEGVGRSGSPAAEAVSDALRRSADPYVGKRRGIAGLSLLSIASLGAVAAYQHGLVRHLPEPPLPGLDADRVDASGEAYELFKAPDATLGIASAAATLLLAGMGDANRTRSRRWIPLALLAKTVLDAAFGLFLTAEQATKHRRFCAYCLLSGLVNVATVPLAIPEARAALRRHT